MQNKERVVVTGIGLVTPLGFDRKAVWDAILHGKNGIALLPTKYQYLQNYGLHLAGIAPQLDFQTLPYLSQKNRRKLENMDKQVQMMIFSALSAFEDASFDIKSQKLGAIIGCGINASDQYEGIAYEDRKPTWFMETYPNVLMGHLFQYLNIKGYATTIVNACCGGMQAIGEAFKKIQYREEIMMLAGGCDDKLNYMCTTGFQRLHMLSSNKDPELAMRPFDKERDGFVMGQGACALILESLTNAKKRGAKIYGEIVGYGTAVDATSIADASSAGKIMAMENALSDANLHYSQIGYINAHGTSTFSNDEEESKAISHVFQEKSNHIPISSTKSFFGHTFAACGALQSYICLKSLSTQTLHKNRNLVSMNSEYKLNILKENLTCRNLEFCISNTSAIGGSNATLVFKRYEYQGGSFHISK